LPATESTPYHRERESRESRRGEGRDKENEVNDGTKTARNPLLHNTSTLIVHQDLLCIEERLVGSLTRDGKMGVVVVVVVGSKPSDAMTKDSSRSINPPLP